MQLPDAKLTSVAWASQLVLEAQRLHSKILLAESSSELVAIIEKSTRCVYIKSADGTVLFGNALYERVFSGGITNGRNSQKFLDPTVLGVSQHSDQIILAGSDTVLLEHHGRDKIGRQLRMHTVKKSLLGCKQHRAAILGMTAVESHENDEAMKLIALSRCWDVFRNLAERDREIAVAIAKGQKSRTLAELYEVTDKTIDNRRAHVLKVLELENAMDLARLLTRLQDNGYCDFGL
ncbi:MAG TPA: hypothetical protein DDW52_04155 [Planctomycetaceae bacterium]|nr:hypothetical protein [Planctomycetaceae bacterium]